MSLCNYISHSTIIIYSTSHVNTVNMGAFALNDLRVLDMKLHHQDMVEGYFLGVDILHQVHKAVAGCGEGRQLAEQDSLAVGGSHLAVGGSHLAGG